VIDQVYTACLLVRTMPFRLQPADPAGPLAGGDVSLPLGRHPCARQLQLLDLGRFEQRFDDYREVIAHGATGQNQITGAQCRVRAE
jgi:hypothetical protein